LIVVAVGKVKEQGLRGVIDEYYSRVRRHVSCQEIEVKDGRDVEDSLIASIPAGAFTVALEVKGEVLTSEQLSRLIVRQGSTSKGVVVFLIGGADGIPGRVSRDASMRMSLSSFTLAHRVARVVLAEQLYRAVSIWKGAPYHRE